MELRFINHTDVLFVEVKILWRKNASTLGFFPEDAFLDHARKKWIIIAEEKGKLLGYLLFRITSSSQRISITHLCISEEFRKKGIPSRLLDELIYKYKETPLRGISLYCREDYKSASLLWERYGFKPLDEKKGKNRDGYKLVFWWYDFGKPDLFSSSVDSSKIQVVVDANIVIHLRDPLSDYNQEAYFLLSDWVINDVDYYYAPEIHNEINRDDDPLRRKHTRATLKKFKEVIIDKSQCNKLFDEVDKLVSGTSVNDISDKKQLSEAICSGFEYFITRDNNLINHSEIILEKFGITILRPNEFILELDEIKNASSYQPARLAGANYDIQKVGRPDINEVSTLFHCAGDQEPKKEFENTIIALTGNVKTCEIKVVKDNFNKIAIIGKIDSGIICEIPVVRIKKDVGGLKNTLFKQLIFEKVSESVKNNQRILKITEKYLAPEYQITLQALGFFNEGDSWIKISLSGLTYVGDLINTYPYLLEYASIKTLLDDYSKINEKEKLTQLKLNIERRLFPLKIVDLDIPTYIIPIKPYWASHLFDTPSANQTLFGAIPELAWNRENVYYRSSRLAGLTYPARIIWYLSDQKFFSRKKHAVAVSYLDELEIGTAKTLFKKNFRYGIYKWKDILKLARHHDNLIMAIKFSDTQLFTRAIPYDKIKDTLFNDNGKSYTFQSPVKIPNHIFLELFKLGMEMNGQK